MYKKGFLVFVVIFLLVNMVLAQEVVSEDIYADVVEEKTCEGFWGKISCFFWGDPVNRAGQAWYDRSTALVGEAADEKTKEAKQAALDSYNWGKKKFEEGDYDVALASFRTAEELYSGAGPKYWIAKTLQAQGKDKESLEAYQEFTGYYEANKQTTASGGIVESRYASEYSDTLAQINILEAAENKFALDLTSMNLEQAQEFLNKAQQEFNTANDAWTKDITNDQKITQKYYDAKAALERAQGKLKQVQETVAGPNYVKSKRDQQLSDKQIRAALKTAGWTDEQIKEAFAVADETKAEERRQQIAQIQPITFAPKSTEWNTARINKAYSCFNSFSCEGEKLNSHQAYQKKLELYYIADLNARFDQNYITYSKSLELAPSGTVSVATDSNTLNQLADDLKIDRSGKSDEELAKAINEGIKEQKEKADKDKVEQIDKLKKDAEDARWQGSYIDMMFKSKTVPITSMDEVEIGESISLPNGDLATVTAKEGDQFIVTINGETKKVDRADAKMVDDTAVKAYQILSGKNQYSELFGATLGALSKLGSYRSLSNLLLPEATKEWTAFSDQEGLRIWADLDAFAASQYCRDDEEKRSTQDGKAYAFVRTSSGTYQFVGSIQAEYTTETTQILCERNPDQDSEEEFICSKGFVCVDNNFCYEDKNDDGEADSNEPAQGHYYKISWGVTAPQDEKFTPYVDENGKAVRFNIQLNGPEGSEWIFKRLGKFGPNVIELDNGANDGGIITKFLQKLYTQVCIVFDPQDSVIDFNGDPVSTICTIFKATTPQSVEYGSATGNSPSITSTSEDVEMNI
ncbi:MAG: hypothetical protein KKA62_05320 [Nanoarchaeota archaeon]|nr:hypothetical protein [Nanoarchaeota archaeon]MBU1643543.1 hypothetical protein [Nanoarchaeota archaeon]MBU1977342.1 hypothetical protein [Nanoarchaeota archaeon]